MTWQSDAVAAFTGVADLVSQGTNTKFWYGLPEFALDQALLWQPREVLRRRTQPDGATPLDLPTWSWAAWEGHCAYRGRGWHNAVTFLPLTMVKWLRKRDLQAFLDEFLASDGTDKAPEEIEAFTRRMLSGRWLSLDALDPSAVLKVSNRHDGWALVPDTVRNEHVFMHAAYPGRRFSYPIALPGEPLLDRVGEDGLLYFVARAVPARFCDDPAATFTQEPLADAFLQIGLRDEHRSANARRPWQHIIYHQGYRAGFLSLNVPLLSSSSLSSSAAEAAAAEEDPLKGGESGDGDDDDDDDDGEEYVLAAMSRDSIPHIAPPAPGWDMYWQSDPRILQATMFFNEEWSDDEAKRAAPPPKDLSAEPDTSHQSEDGNPHWDEGRFGDVAFFDVYNVLLLRWRPAASSAAAMERGRSHWERIGVGKVNVRAFRYAKPIEQTFELR